MSTQTRLQHTMRFFMASGWTVLAIVSTVRVVGHGGPPDMPWLPYALPICAAVYAVVHWRRFFQRLRQKEPV